MGCVYIATNLLNGTQYVGYTTKTLDQRKQEHEYCAEHRTPKGFTAALRKHGPENFFWVEVFVHQNPLVLLFHERDLIRELRAKGRRLYNLTQGGEGTPGYKWPEHQLVNKKNSVLASWKNESSRATRILKMHKNNLERMLRSRQLLIPSLPHRPEVVVRNLSVGGRSKFRKSGTESRFNRREWAKVEYWNRRIPELTLLIDGMSPPDRKK